MLLVREATVAMAVARNIDAAVADRLRRRAPELAARLVAHEECLAGGIGHRIVGPWGELVLPAVAGPGAGAAVGRDLEAEARVGDDVDPGCGRGLTVGEYGHVFAAVEVEAAESVEELQPRCVRALRLPRQGGGWQLRGRFERRARGERRLGQSRNLPGDVAPTRQQHHAGC